MYYKKLLFDNYHSITKKFIKRYHTFETFKTCHSEIFQLSELENFPELLIEFKKYHLEVDIFKIFVTPPNYSISPHIDGNDLFPKYWALNWPILNCNNTYMYWYKLKKSALSNPLINDNRYTDQLTNIIPYRYCIEDCEKIDTLELLDPYLVNISTVHNVSNPNPYKSRVILSFRFKPEPLHLLH